MARYNFVTRDEFKMVMEEIATLVGVNPEYVDEDGFAIEKQEEQGLVKITWTSYAHFNKGEFETWVNSIYKKAEQQ